MVSGKPASSLFEINDPAHRDHIPFIDRSSSCFLQLPERNNLASKDSFLAGPIRNRLAEARTPDDAKRIVREATLETLRIAAECLLPPHTTLLLASVEAPPANANDGTEPEDAEDGLDKATSSVTATSAQLFSVFQRTTEDICIGLADGNRTGLNDNSTTVILINLLPIRPTYDSKQTFGDTIVETRNQTRETLTNSKLPFDVLLQQPVIPPQKNLCSQPSRHC